MVHFGEIQFEKAARQAPLHLYSNRERNQHTKHLAVVGEGKRAFANVGTVPLPSQLPF